jgi:hypothetical protein
VRDLPAPERGLRLIRLIRVAQRPRILVLLHGGALPAAAEVPGGLGLLLLLRLPGGVQVPQRNRRPQLLQIDLVVTVRVGVAHDPGQLL